MRGADAARAIAERNLRCKTEHFAEVFLDGREFNLSLLDGPSGPAVLPIAEIVFDGFAGAPRIVGYDAKWTPDSAAYIGTPRRFGLEAENPELAAKLASLARACWQLFALTGYARVDFRLDAQGEPAILEVNMRSSKALCSELVPLIAHRCSTYSDCAPHRPPHAPRR